MQSSKVKPGSCDSASHPSSTLAGTCAFLEVVSVTRAGAFLKQAGGRDLLVPISQQLIPMVAGQSYVIYLYLDPQQQLIGSSKLYKFLDERARNMAAGEAVDLLIVTTTDLGYKAVVNGTHLGLLYKGEVFQPLKAGDRTRGYIKTIRADRKIDLSLQRQNQQSKNALGERILAFLKANGGVSSLTDYSPPEAIYKQYGVSKGNYKKALGALYKQHRISVAKDKIELLA